MDGEVEGGEIQMDDTLPIEANETTGMGEDTDTQMESVTTTTTGYDTISSYVIQSHDCSSTELPELTEEQINLILNRFRNRPTTPV